MASDAKPVYRKQLRGLRASVRNLMKRKAALRKLIEFIRSIYVVVLFVVLEVSAVSYYAHSSAYTQARLLAPSNQWSGGIRSFFGGIRRYFLLGGENRVLLDRITQFEERLARYEEVVAAARLDSCLQSLGESKFSYRVASVASNSINRQQNLITLNRGRNAGIQPDMSVLTPDGAMVGYVVDCTDRYAVAMSVLNTSFRASGKLADSDYLGSIYWDGLDPHVVILGELSKYAEPHPGDEVVTTGFSEYFPEGVRIGWVESAELDPMRTSYTVRVRLAAEMSRLTDVIVVENRDLNEIRALQQSELIEQHTRM